MTDLYQHLVERGMDPDRYRVFYDAEEEAITFLLYNLSGQVVGFQRYRPGNDQKKKRNDEEYGRYFTYTAQYKTDDGKAVIDGVFGLEALTDPFKRTDRPLYIVEGVFKASTLHRLGYDALAVLTSHPKRLRPLFRLFRAVRPVVAIGDNDAAGQKLVRCVGRGFVSPGDLDEMSDADVHQLLKENQ